MQKIANYNGTLMSLVLLEEKLASFNGLHVWECTCGSNFVTVYYASYHCEKHHNGDVFKERIKLKKDLITNTRLWNAFYCSISDIVVKTISPEKQIPSDSQVEQPESVSMDSRNIKAEVVESESRKREPSDYSIDHASESKRKKVSCCNNATNKEVSSIICYSEMGTNTEEQRQICKKETQGPFTSAYKVLHKTDAQTTLTSTISGIEDYDILWQKVEQDEHFYENSLFAPKAPRKCLDDKIDVSTQTTPIGMQIDFVLINEVKTNDSNLKIFGNAKGAQTDQTQDDDKMDLDTSGDSEPPARFTICPHPSESSSPQDQPGPSSQQIATIAVQNVNNNQSLSIFPLLPPPIPPVIVPSAVTMIMRPELPFPIPEPSTYPYPPFGLIYQHSQLYHADGTQTVFHWQKRAEFFMELKDKNMNPPAARDLWMLRNVPSSLVNYQLG